MFLNFQDKIEDLDNAIPSSENGTWEKIDSTYSEDLKIELWSFHSFFEEYRVVVRKKEDNKCLEGYICYKQHEANLTYQVLREDIFNIKRLSWRDGPWPGEKY